MRRCPSCGAQAPANLRVCTACGFDLKSERQKEADGATSQPTNRPSGAALGYLTIVAIVVIAVIAMAIVGGDNARSPSGGGGPEPGSPADRYCDTNEVGPGTVQYGSKSYDSDCLDTYSWES